MADKFLQNYDLLKELMPHGNMMFPLTVHEVETDVRSAERVGCHWHDEFEILAVTSGTAQIRVGKKSYDAEKGDIAFVPADHLHMVTAREGSPFSFLAVVFHPSFLSSYSNDTIQQQYLDGVWTGKTLFPELLSSKSSASRQVLYWM